MNLAEAQRDLPGLVNKVFTERITIDLERDDMVVARLTPVEPKAKMTMAKLNAFLNSLPRLGDDLEEFSSDIRAIRRDFPSETSAWD